MKHEPSSAGLNARRKSETLSHEGAIWTVSDLLGGTVKTKRLAITGVVAAILGGTFLGGAPAEASPRFQADCGRFSCTIRFNHQTTRDATDAAGVLAAIGGGCATVSGPLAPVCGAAIAPSAAILALAANRYDRAGDCLGIRIYKPINGLTTAIPRRVKGGTRNCV
ncbi:hypothetical protein [Cryptosporangium aurantiacum]|uniref:hypothetical protein n=1 Tax=Cryptosporangium aurantiacum TaxID=134849 RepID=UPI001160F953|nr:hypothetical protein [Cryptosporangium aurantiacum]